MWDEAVVVVHHPKKLLELALGRRLRELLNGVALGRKWSDACWRDCVSKKLDGCHTELGLVCVDLDAIILQPLEDLVEVLLVASFIRTGDEEIVDVGEAEGQTSKDLVDEALEGLCCIPQSKRHPDVFEQSKRCDDGCLRDVIRMNWNLVEGFDEVDS